MSTRLELAAATVTHWRYQCRVRRRRCNSDADWMHRRRCNADADWMPMTSEAYYSSGYSYHCDDVTHHAHTACYN